MQSSILNESLILTSQKPNGQAEGPEVCDLSLPSLSCILTWLLWLPQHPWPGFTFRPFSFAHSLEQW